MMARLAALLAAATTLLSATLAHTQEAAPPASADTVVAPVTVTGRRATPESESRSASCEQAVRDPTVRALMAAGVMPRIMVPTYETRNPDYSAPPKSAPGSAMPKVMSQKERARAAGIGRSTTSQRNALRRTMNQMRTSWSTGEAPSLESALAWCQLGMAGGVSEYGTGFGADSAPAFGTFPGPQFDSGRAHIARNDKTLPLGFALFDEGRYAEALVQFQKAFKKLPDIDGGQEAALMMGKIYLYGLKENADPRQAAYWLDRAAYARFDGWRYMPVFDPREPDRNTSIGEASLILAGLYRTGHGTLPKDIDKSAKYFKRAFYVGHVPAAKMLGDLYYEGVDTPRDLKDAFRNYMDGAKFAYPPAMMAVAHMYEAGEAPGGADPRKALAWRAEAASRNDPEALYALAVAYDRGTGVEAEPDRAVSLYKLAAVNGHAGAQAAIASYFYKGEAGIPLDLGLARRWFEQAAVGGDTDGMFNLAAMMARGEGGEVDRVRAWAWLKIAAKAGHENAPAAARALEAQMTPQDRAGIAHLTAEKTG